MTGGKGIGAAVIGLKMGRNHLEGYARNRYTQVVGVCDTDRELLQRTAEDFGARQAETDYRRLLDNPDISLISVATPNALHEEQVIAALEAGKDVLCEKPMASTVAECRRMIEAVRRTGRRFMIGHICRFAPGFALAHKLASRGDIGDLFLVESEYAHYCGHIPGAGNWRQNPSWDPFTSGGCHAVDLLRWNAGEVEEVFALANHKCLPDWSSNDCTMAMLRFQGGVIGKVMASIGCMRPYTMRTVLYGTGGTIICDNKRPFIEFCNIKDPHIMSFAEIPVDINHHNAPAEVDEMVDAILHDRPLELNEIEGARNVAVCEAVLESARSGAPVPVPSIP